MRNVPSWQEYFMKIATDIAARSKDPSTSVGALVTTKNNILIGSGFNGFASGMEETEELWQRPIKYNYVIHAEANSLINCSRLNKARIMYCTLYPCKDCAKLIAGTKIKTIYYKDHEINGKSYLDPISQDIFKRCNIEVIQLK